MTLPHEWKSSSRQVYCCAVLRFSLVRSIKCECIAQLSCHVTSTNAATELVRGGSCMCGLRVWSLHTGRAVRQCLRCVHCVSAIGAPVVGSGREDADADSRERGEHLSVSLGCVGRMI